MAVQEQLLFKDSKIKTRIAPIYNLSDLLFVKDQTFMAQAMTGPIAVHNTGLIEEGRKVCIPMYGMELLSLTRDPWVVYAKAGTLRTYFRNKETKYNYDKPNHLINANFKTVHESSFVWYMKISQTSGEEADVLRGISEILDAFEIRAFNGYNPHRVGDILSAAGTGN